MTKVTAKIKSARVLEDGQVCITAQFTTKGQVWEKTYTYYTTQPIKIDDLKRRISNDIKGDLALKSQLQEIESHIGKTFTIEV
jgi:hypothetical protein